MVWPPGAGWVCLLPLLWDEGTWRLSLAAQHWGPDCYTGPVWRWAMALQFISCCSPPMRAPGAHSSSVRALRKMDWLAGPPEEAKRVAKRLCSTWLLSYASLMKDVFNCSLGNNYYRMLDSQSILQLWRTGRIWRMPSRIWRKPMIQMNGARLGM